MPVTSGCLVRSCISDDPRQLEAGTIASWVPWWRLHPCLGCIYVLGQQGAWSLGGLCDHLWCGCLSSGGLGGHTKQARPHRCCVPTVHTGVSVSNTHARRTVVWVIISNPTRAHAWGALRPKMSRPYLTSTSRRAALPCRVYGHFRNGSLASHDHDSRAGTASLPSINFTCVLTDAPRLAVKVCSSERILRSTRLRVPADNKASGACNVIFSWFTAAREQKGGHSLEGSQTKFANHHSHSFGLNCLLSSGAKLDGLTVLLSERDKGRTQCCIPTAS